MQKNNYKSSDIFIKSDVKKIILSKNDLFKVIPNNCSDIKLRHLMSNNIEWRWRFYEINGHTLIEISKKYPKSNRLFLDYNGNWIEYKLDISVKKYIVGKKYYYTET